MIWVYTKKSILNTPDKKGKRDIFKQKFSIYPNTINYNKFRTVKRIFIDKFFLYTLEAKISNF